MESSAFSIRTRPALHHLQLLSPQTAAGHAASTQDVRDRTGTGPSQAPVFHHRLVVMPEHVHLLLSEPEVGKLSASIQVIKQLVSRRLGSTDERFWQRRYYDFNVWTDAKRIEKLRYIHRNPVKRGLVQRPADWTWSSFRHWATGEQSVVEIESQWTARKREQNGIQLQVSRQYPNCPTLRKTGEG
jgi:hypothetical protein